MRCMQRRTSPKALIFVSPVSPTRRMRTPTTMTDVQCYFIESIDKQDGHQSYRRAIAPKTMMPGQVISREEPFATVHTSIALTVSSSLATKADRGNVALVDANSPTTAVDSAKASIIGQYISILASDMLQSLGKPRSNMPGDPEIVTFHWRTSCWQGLSTLFYANRVEFQ